MSVHMEPPDLQPAILQLEGLSTDITTSHGAVHAVDTVSLSIAEGETLGLVGESGCGKTMTAMSIAGLLPPAGKIVSGRIRLGGRDLLTMGAGQARRARASQIGVVFQNPTSALNPRMTIGTQLREALAPELRRDRRASVRRCAELLDMVRVPRPWDRLADYPHELSGGLAQRMVIALAFARDARLLIADEPTTALDVSIQAQILDLIDNLKRDLQLGILLVTHDMAVVADRSDRVAVMYAGQVIEEGPTSIVLESPRHQYTRGLLESAPAVHGAGRKALRGIPGSPPALVDPPRGCRFGARCPQTSDSCVDMPQRVQDDDRHWYACWHPADAIPARLRAVSADPETPAPGSVQALYGDSDPIIELVDVSQEYVVARRTLWFGKDRRRHAVSHVNLQIRRGEALGLVGESGCGKSTLARLISGLDRPTSGEVRYQGTNIRTLAGAAKKDWRGAVQLVFQDPYSSLDPVHTVGTTVGEPLRYRSGTRPDDELIGRLLNEVGLPEDTALRRPSQLSGGQRQRVGIARALALDPRVVLADEIVSALDVSVQAAVLNLLKSLQRERSLTLLFISHDLGVVRYVCDRIAVMYLGKIVETGPAEELFDAPAHPYTAALLAAEPGHKAGDDLRSTPVHLTGELPSAEQPPAGCRFHTRCPLATQRCHTVEPPLVATSAGRTVACHFPL